MSVPATTGEAVAEGRLVGTVDQGINLRAEVAAERDLLRSTLSGAERTQKLTVRVFASVTFDNWLHQSRMHPQAQVEPDRAQYSVQLSVAKSL